MKVTLENISMGYNSNLVVRDLHLEVDSGKTLVLLGPSGCGKTSTMRTIAGLETPTKGTISIGDRVVFDAARGIDVPTHKRRAGMVFQSYAIWPHMTVADNVGFPLKMLKEPKKERMRKVEAVLDLVGLSGMGERGASLVSGGQMQRIALARSLAMSPDVVLFDEPLSNLDAKLRESLRVELKHIQQEVGLTSIYVTHDQAEALALGDIIAVMREGQVEQLASPMELFRKPASAFVADFLGVTNIFQTYLLPGTDNSYAVADVSISVVESMPNEIEGPLALCIRPDAVQVMSPSGRAGETNTWSGRVDVASYLGTMVRYRVTLDVGMRLDATVAGDEAQPFQAGDEVEVRVPAERVFLVANRGLKRTAP